MAASQVRAEWPDACIVIVDDEPAIRQVLQELLVTTGYTDVHAFGDPAEAVDAYVDLAPDLTLLDLNMPGMDGTEVLRQLREAPEPRAPIIVMTGGARSQDVHETLTLGAADFLHKPVDATELLLRVRHQLRQRRLRQELAGQNRRLEQLAAERAGELALLSRVLDDIPIAASVLDPGLQLRYANTLARQLLRPGATSLGATLFPADEAETTLDAFLESAITSKSRRLSCQLRRGDEPPRRVEVEAQRVQGELIAVLVHDIEERERATDALRRALELEQRANEDLRSVEQLRAHFLSAVSHELRTPLTVVLGMSESLDRHDDELDPSQRRELLGRLHRNARRLGGLLDDLLDLNRLAVGQLHVQPTTNDLARIVADAVAEVDREEHPLTVEVASMDVEAEAPRIQRVVANLVRNAVVHTPPDTPIRVVGERDGPVVRLRVIDRGPGVSPALRERIFDPFEQGPSVPRHRPGTGIGLSLVREFVRLHGGRAWVEETPGGGATFVVELNAGTG